MVSEHASPLAMPGSDADAGGQNVYVAELATMLGRLGCEVVVHTRRTSPDVPRRVELARNVIVDHVPAGPPARVFRDDLFPYMDEFAADLRRVWRRSPPDVVHAHFWMSGWAALEAAWPLGIPVVQTFHALGVVKHRQQGAKDTSPPERLETEAHVLRRADTIVATCSDEAFELLRLGAEMDGVSVIPCGVGLDRFQPDGPTEPRPANGRRRLVVAARLVERKGIGNTIEALSHVPGCELVVAGGPPGGRVTDDAEGRRLYDLARQLGVDDRVDFRGFTSQESLPALLRSSDVAVCVPWYEPFGISAVEAMACGVPVVASCVGGLLDTVVDGVNGVHVPPRDPARLAEALGELLASPSTMRSYGEAGVRRARDHYSWQRITADTLDVYSSLVGGRAFAMGARR
jgi:D-inositol-3-phosphate glycosyltransferase